MNTTDWQPTASIETLQSRAEFLRKIRDFFHQKQILEVETPSLSRYTITDLHIDSIAVNDYGYLQTSPEYHMKRLLAAGSPSIYQICKSFRCDQSGRRHNPEFTMLEWYHLDYDLPKIIDELDELLQVTIDTPSAERLSYQAIFQKYVDICPHRASLTELKNIAMLHNIEIHACDDDKDMWLDILMTHIIEPQLGIARPTFVFDYPASQSALARIRPGEIPVAERFELYIQGMEIGNGYFELTDPQEQRKRFEENRSARTLAKKIVPEIDPLFMSALESGLPSCAGVAVGLDRLLMAGLRKTHISEVMSFTLENA